MGQLPTTQLDNRSTLWGKEMVWSGIMATTCFPDTEAHSSRPESQHISLSLALWTGQILPGENSPVIVGLISGRLLCVEKHLSDGQRAIARGSCSLSRIFSALGITAENLNGRLVLEDGASGTLSLAWLLHHVSGHNATTCPGLASTCSG